MKHNFEKYCKDYKNIENYDKALADNFIGWCCHHRKGELMPTKKLQALKMYFNRPANELIFLTESEHDSLHHKGKHHSEEHKKKMSEAKKGKYAGENNPMYGKKHSDETRRKMSDAKKDMSEETRKKISVGHKGKPKSEEHKKKLSKALKVMCWFNNGKINIRAKECPPGYEPGMLKRK